MGFDGARRDGKGLMTSDRHKERKPNMTEKQVLQAFMDTDALLEGHFELRSKLHSNRYFQCANVLR